jgi:hypothetical protein
MGAMTPAAYAARGESLIADDILENVAIVTIIFKYLT